MNAIGFAQEDLHTADIQKWCTDRRLCLVPDVRTLLLNPRPA
jgi:hypothetical protein